MPTCSPTAPLLVAASPTLLRHGLLLLLREAWPDCSATLITAPAALLARLQERHYALLIVDSLSFATAVLPSLLLQVRRLRPHLPLLVLTGRRPPALRLASPLYLLPRQAPPTEVTRAAAALLAPAAQPLACQVARPRQVGFTPRELEVLALVMADLNNAQIAERLYLNVRTIESHRRALLHKANVRTSVGLVVRALREGWVSY